MSKTKEKQILFRLDEKTYALATEKTEELGLTVSAMAKVLITRMASGRDLKCMPLESNDERMRFSLSAAEKTAIAGYAQLNNWSMSRECRFRIISSLSAKSKLLPDELQKIKGLRSAIDAVGRNIRHMMFNKKLVVNDPACMEEIEKLNQYMAVAINKIKELEATTADRWQFNLRGMRG